MHQKFAFFLIMFPFLKPFSIIIDILWLFSLFSIPPPSPPPYPSPLPSLFLCLAPVAPPLLSIELPLYVVAMLN